MWQATRIAWYPMNNWLNQSSLIMRWISMQKQGYIYNVSGPCPTSTKVNQVQRMELRDRKGKDDNEPSLLYQIHKAPMKELLLQPDDLRMTEAGFDLVDWWSVKRALDGFPEMFHVWASKHMSWCKRSAVSGTTVNAHTVNKIMRWHLMCSRVRVRVQTQNGRIGFCILDFGCLKLTCILQSISALSTASPNKWIP